MNVVPSVWFGFTAGKSTEVALNYFTEEIYNSINSNKKASGLFVDFSKAFDLVDHGILLEKLHYAGVRGIPNDWFASFLKERTQQIPYPRPAASVELRCGVLYSGCQCVKRNGLQQDCPRSACQGRASCLDYPAPTCQPSGNSLCPYQSPCELRQGHAETLQGRWASGGDQDLRYKRRMDDKLRDIARQGYVDHPAFNPRNNIPCRVHRRDELRTTLGRS